MVRKSNRKYCYDNAARMEDLLTDEFCDGLNIKNAQLNTDKFCRGKKVKRRFVRRVFTDFLKLVIDDCIENNAKFISPSRFWWALYIKEKYHKEVKRIMRNNKIYTDIDFIQSDGKIYEFVWYSLYLRKGNRLRGVRIGWTKYKELVKKVNEGMRYFIK